MSENSEFKRRRRSGSEGGGGRQRANKGPRRGDSGRRTEAADTYIYGLHAAEFALRNGDRDVRAIWATENAERKLADAIKSRRTGALDVIRVAPRDLDKRLGADTVHQGIALDVAPLRTWEIQDLAEIAARTHRPIVALDQVTDPHNVGAVLRSAAVFGAAGIVMTERHSPPLGGTLAKAASGALDLTPVCLVQNLARALDELKGQSFAVIGLDGRAENRLLEDGLGGLRQQPIVLVFGAEGRGLRDLTQKSCDALCRIGSAGPIASLNVSNAAAIALHLAAMLRRST